MQHLGDITKISGYTAPIVDCIIGGSPCQSLSIVQSKTRKHLDGKSKLFFEYVRAKEEMHPKWFLFENVASMNEESKYVISDLLGCEPIFIDSGDFSAQERPRYYFLYAGDSVTVNTKVHLEIPKGYCGLLKSKSGLLVKHCISGEGVIDHGFLGAIHVKLFNNSKDEKMHFFEKGDKLIQLLIVPIETPELELVESIQELYGGDTERGTNGFGSSGK